MDRRSALQAGAALAATPVAKACGGVSETKPPRQETVATDRGGIPVYWAWPDRAIVEHVVVVLHGMDRNAQAYRDDWMPLVKRRGLAVMAPHFESRRFHGWRGYNMGGMLDPAGKPTPKESWVFGALDQLIAYVAARSGARKTWLYGHSAGAQLAYRHRVFGPLGGPDVAGTLVANAGWYTGLTDDWPFPYGLAGAPEGVALRNRLTHPLWLLAGDTDTDRAHPGLRRGPLADLQGPHRLARAEMAFALAQARAEQLKVDLNWRLHVLPGVGHSNQAVAKSLLQSAWFAQ